MQTIIRERIRPYANTIGAPLVGFLIAYMFDLFLGIDLSKMSTSILNLGVVSFFAFHFFPRMRGIPFGKI